MKASLIIAVLLAVVLAPSCALKGVRMSDIPQSILEITKGSISTSQLAQYPFQNPDNCNQIRFQGCQYAFNDYLGIATDADWRDPNVLAQEILARYRQGPEGLLQMCRANQLLYSCLGTTYFSCFNPLYLIGRNFGLQNSFQFSSEMLSLWFQCTGGLEQSIGQWQCIGEAYNASTDAVNACVNTFNSSINTDPSYNNFCQATQVFMYCLAQSYAVCGTTAQWWVCEDVRVSFSLFLCNNLQCRVTESGFGDQPIGGFNSVVDAAGDGSLKNGIQDSH